MREIAVDVAALDADAADIGARITRITDALPTPEDIARVEALLTEHHGWPDVS